jgi:hypothetical protein
LLDLVPTLSGLRISVEEGTALAQKRHVRHVVLNRAAARFFVACGDEACEGGGYDLSAEILAFLKVGTQVFGGTLSCPGVVGKASCAAGRGASCGRRLRYQVQAQFQHMSGDSL